MILIVDDFIDGAAMLCRVLTSDGYPCTPVNSGQAALAFINTHPREQPLLVILDVMMPGMTGIDVLKALRSNPATVGTTVIMFTAGFDAHQRDEAMMLGVAAWMLKGNDFEQIMDTIHSWYASVGGVRTVPAKN